MTTGESAVGVIIVNYRTADLIERLVVRLSETRERIASIVVVDNDPGDLGDRLAARHHDVDIAYIARDRNRGYPSAVNVGWRALVEPYVLLLNPDADVEPSAISRMAEALDREARVAAVAPLHLDPDGTVTNPYRSLPGWLDLIAERTHLYRFGWAKARVSRYEAAELDRIDQSWPLTAVQQPPASCLLLRRGAIRGTPMDERFPFLFNDVDLSRGLLEDGWSTVIETGAQCTHVPNTSGRYLGRRAEAENNLGAVRYCRKWEGRFAAAALRGALIAEAAITIRRRPEARETLRALVNGRSIFESEGVGDPVRPWWPGRS